MKQIYLILTHTGTILSNIIRSYTKDEFSHVSISLDKNLNKMYSFGRLNPYNPFVGGFINEKTTSGTFKRFKNTKTIIYEVDVQDWQYEKLENLINNIGNCIAPYKFNVLGLFAVSINKKIHKIHSFYCAEFVKYALEKIGVENNLPEIIRPEDFKKVKRKHTIYQGLLREYRPVAG